MVDGLARFGPRDPLENRESPYAKRAETQRKLLAQRRVTPEGLEGLRNRPERLGCRIDWEMDVGCRPGGF